MSRFDELMALANEGAEDAPVDDRFAELMALAEQEPAAEEQQGLLNNSLRGAGDRATSLAGNLVNLGAEVFDRFNTAHDFGQFLLGKAAGAVEGDTLPEAQRAVSSVFRKAAGVVEDTGTAIAGADFGYVPQATPEDIKKAWSDGDVKQLASTVGGFIVEQGIRTLPDMAAILGVPTMYLASRTEELATERARNDGRDTPNTNDFAWGAGTAAAVSYLERIGAKASFLRDTPVEKLADVPGAAGKAFVKEGATEFVQEGLEDIGTTTDTKTGFDLSRAAERGFFGALAGGPTGATLATGTGIIQSQLSGARTSNPVVDSFIDDMEKQSEELGRRTAYEVSARNQAVIDAQGQPRMGPEPLVDYPRPPEQTLGERNQGIINSVMPGRFVENFTPEQVRENEIAEAFKAREAELQRQARLEEAAARLQGRFSGEERVVDTLPKPKPVQDVEPAPVQDEPVDRYEAMAEDLRFSRKVQQDVAALNEALARQYPNENLEKAYEPDTLQPEDQPVASALEAVFGRRVVPVRATDPRNDLFDGFRISSNEGVVYVNPQGTIDPVKVIGHELWHDVVQRRKDLADWFNSAAEKHLTGLGRYQQDLNQSLLEGEQPLSTAEAREELLADFQGEALSDPEFLQTLANDNPGKFKQLLEAVLTRLTTIAKRLKGTYGTEAYIDDVEALRGYLRQVLKAYAAGEPIASVEQPAMNREAAPAVEGRTQPPADDRVPAPAADDRVPAEDVKLSRQGNRGDTHNMGVARGARVVGAGRLSAAETKIVKAAAKRLGVTQKAIRERVLETKQRYPVSDGWAPIELKKVTLNAKGNISPEWKAVPYTFESAGEGPLAKGLINEYRKLEDRAAAGDNAAKVSLRQIAWYANMRDRLREEYGSFGDLFADLLGATSPNTAVQLNWRFAKDALSRAMNGDYDSVITNIVAWDNARIQREATADSYLIEQREEGRRVADIKNDEYYKDLVAAQPLPPEATPYRRDASGQPSRFGMNSAHVARALADLWRVVTPGSAPKAKNFSGNLIGYTNEATIDVWAARMLQRLAGEKRVPPVAQVGVRGSHKIGSTKENPQIGAQYGVAQRAFREAADTLGINPDGLQAVVWFAEKEVWTANGWTTTAGEGGSFEQEADADPVDRFTGMLSIEQSAENQGSDYVPTDADMAAVNAEILAAAQEIEGEVIAKSQSTIGRFGQDERAFDIEVVAPRGADPMPLWRKLNEIGKRENQQAVGLSRVVQPDEDIDPTLHRPGVEIYFSNPTELTDAGAILEQLNSLGAEFFTFAIDARRNTRTVAGDMGKVVGLRIQYVPEFIDNPAAGAAARESLLDLHEYATGVQGVNSAQLVYYETSIAFDGDYDGNLRGNADQGASSGGAQVWKGLRVREGFEATDSEIRAARGQDVEGAVPSVRGTKFSRKRPDAAGRGGLRAGTYGTPVEGAVSVTGVHYSLYERETLDSTKYGTGRPGAERARLGRDSANPATRNRIFFYVDEGKGVDPEAGVGGTPHAVQLDNLYDIMDDPQEFVTQAQEQYTNRDDQMNHVEWLAHDAGFDGLYTRAAFGNQGVAVLLGDHQVPVGANNQEEAADARDTRRAAPEVRRGAAATTAEESGRDRRGVRRAEEPLGEPRWPDPAYPETTEESLSGLPATVKVDGRSVTFGAFSTAREAAENYMATAGLAYDPPVTYAKVDRERASRIAAAYDEMAHAPDDPEVQAAYQALADETVEQYRAVLATGLEVEFMPEDGDPYGNPRNVISDVVNNDHMYVYSTTAGFGSNEDFDAAGNPLLAETEFEISGRPALVNDLFRVVHDYFGHVKEGVGFRADGEENAWRSHAAMFSPEARRALTSETRGQNSWVNYGPYGEQNRTASAEDTVFADQKTGLLPEWVSEEGATDTFDPANPDIRASRRRRDLTPGQEAFLSKIGPSAAQTMKQRWDGFTERLWLRIKQGLVDKYAALLEVDKQLLGDDVLKSGPSIRFAGYALARMSDVGGSALTSMLRAGRLTYDPAEGMIDVDTSKPGLMEVLARLGGPEEIDSFLGWIAANRGKALMAQGRENLFTAAEIAEGLTLNRGTTELGDDRAVLYPKMKRAFDLYKSDVLEIAKQAGIIDPVWADAWKNDWYVPFYRLMDEDEVSGPRMGGGSLKPKEAFKKLKGGKENLNDLLENTLMNYHHLLSQSMKNIATKQALENSEAVGVAEKTPEAARARKASTYYFKEGRKVWYNVTDPMVFNSLTMISTSGMNNASMRVLRGFKRLFTNFVTASPQFIVRNLIRDTLHSIAVAPEMSLNAPKNAVKGIASYGFGDSMTDVRAQMLTTGAAFSFGHIYGEHIDDLKYQIGRQKRSVVRVSTPQNAADAIAVMGRTARRAWERYHAISDSAENANRAALYQQVLTTEGSKLRAAYESRNLLDFGKHGAWPAVRFLTDTVPFLNARLQGLTRMGETFAGDPSKSGVAKLFSSTPERKRLALVIGAMSLATIALRYANEDDEEYKRLEDWDKDGSWHIFPGTFGEEGDWHVIIPKPFEVGAIATMAERMFEQAIDDEATAKDFKKSVSHMLLHTFSFNPLPQAFAPLWDISTNKDSFTGRDIENMSMRNLSPVERKRASTTSAAVGISQALDATVGKISPDAVLSPVQVDFLVRNYLGWVGSASISMLSGIYDGWDGKERPKKYFTEYQPMRSFYRDESLPGFTKHMTEFYELYREADRVASDRRKYMLHGEEDKINKLLADPKKMKRLELNKVLASTGRKLSKINREIEILNLKKGMPAEEKRRRIDELRLIKNTIAEDIMKTARAHLGKYR